MDASGYAPVRSDAYDVPARRDEPPSFDAPVPARATERGLITTNTSPDPDPSETVISNDITVEGNISSTGRLRLEGTVQGDISGTAVTVADGGQVTGSVLADEVAIFGQVSGTVRGREVMLYKSARVDGDIVHQGIGMEMGTHYEGRLSWDREASPSPADAGRDPQATNAGPERPQPMGFAGPPRSNA